jgi:hypothetical protein
MSLFPYLLAVTYLGCPTFLFDFHRYQVIPSDHDAPPPAKQPAETFRPARYKSIQFGKSTQTEVIKLFGPPYASGLGTDRSIHLHYKDIWLTPGEVEVFIDPTSRLVHGMAIYPEKRTISYITALLGNKFVTSRYDLKVNTSDGDGDNAVVFRHSRGKYKMLEYLHLGIYVILKDESVFYVLYADSPYGRQGR